MSRKRETWTASMQSLAWGSRNMDSDDHILHAHIDRDGRRVNVTLPRQIIIWLIRSVIRNQPALMVEAVEGTEYERK